MSVVDSIHERLWQQADLPTDQRQMADRIRDLVVESLPLVAPEVREQMVAEVGARVTGLGPLQALADDPAVSEIMVNAGTDVWVERCGHLERVPIDLDSGSIENLVRRMASAVGRRVDQTSPAVDIRLADGSRMHAILPPLAIDGASVTIRRFRPIDVELDELAPGPPGEFLAHAIRARATIIVAGATSTGKTTLLNGLARCIDHSDRVVTIEEAAELRLRCPHVVRLETRVASEGVAAVGLRELVRHALRMRPDRIICGEMRGAESLDLVQAMNTGHPGSLSTVHANSASDTLRRIETMMLMGNADLPLSAIREQLASCIDIIVSMTRGKDSSRTVASIDEVPMTPDHQWVVSTLFEDGQRLADPKRLWWRL